MMRSNGEPTVVQPQGLSGLKVDPMLGEIRRALRWVEFEHGA